MNKEGKTQLGATEVARLERVLGGDPVTEEMILRFIGDKYGSRNLFFLPAKAAVEAMRRPDDFIRAAKLHCQPELGF